MRHPDNRVNATPAVLRNCMRQVNPHLDGRNYHQLAVTLNAREIPYPSRYQTGWTEKRVSKFLLTMGLARRIMRPALPASREQRKISTLLVTLKTVLAWRTNGEGSFLELEEFPRDQIERTIAEAER